MMTEPLRQPESAATRAPKPETVWRIRHGLPLALAPPMFLACGRSLSDQFVCDDNLQVGGQVYARKARDWSYLAIPQYRRVLKLDPNHGDAHFRPRYIYNKLGIEVEAERFLRGAIEVYPRRARPYLFLAFRRLNRGQFDEAADVLHRALNAGDGVQSAHYGLALLARRRGDLRTALTEVDAGVAVNPGLRRRCNRVCR